MFPAAYNKNAFRLAHETVLTSLQNIQARIRVFAEARKYFPDLAGALEAHLGAQDGRFYSVLEEFFSADRQASATIMYFREDLKEIKVSSLAFWETYMTGVPRPSAVRQFPLETVRFFELIKARIHAEEGYLLPLLDRYGQQISSPPDTI